MKLFEDLIDKTAKFADEAVKAGKEALEQTKVVAGEAMEKGKKKVNQLQLEGELREAQRKLGALVYLQYKTGEKNDELVSQYIDEIEKIDTAIEELKLENVSEQPDCAVEEIKEETIEFVNDITEEVEEAIDEVKKAVACDDEIRVCKSCGTQADDNDIFCRDCGSKLD